MSVVKVILNTDYDATPWDDEHYLLTSNGRDNKPDGYTMRMRYKKYGYANWEEMLSGFLRTNSVIGLVHSTPFNRKDWL